MSENIQETTVVEQPAQEAIAQEESGVKNILAQTESDTFVDSEPSNEGDNMPEKDDAIDDSFSLYEALKGTEYDKDTVDSFLDIAKELKLTKTQASEISKTMLKKLAESQRGVIENASKEWINQIENDDELKDTNALAKSAMKAIEKFGTPQLNEIMLNSPLGNHPELLRFMKRVGDSLGATFVKGDSSAAKLDAKGFYDKSNLND